MKSLVGGPYRTTTIGRFRVVERPAPTGLGDVNDLIAQALDPQIQAVKIAALAEIDKKGEEAKKRALYGGLAAGFVGALMGIGVGYILFKKA